jgi:transcriptional regulator with XRE-family HTH domain
VRVAKGIHDDRYRALLRLLREHRLAQGTTQTVLAERLHRPQQFVSKYESGERRLDVVEFMDVARALGLDWSETLRAVDKPRS